MKNTIFNPIFKDTCVFLRTAAETDGRISEMEIILGPGGGNPLHRHTNEKGFPKSLMTIAVIGELGNTALTGAMSLASPILKILATFGRRKGHEQELLKKYCQ